MDNRQLDQKIYSLEDCILHCSIIDNNQEFSAIILPENLQQAAMLLAHDHSGHNGFRRTYAALQILSFWKGMKHDVLKHCKHYNTCVLQKLECVKFECSYFKPGHPMEFISMDLISEFSPQPRKAIIMY